MKLKAISPDDNVYGAKEGYFFFCPGCKCDHVVIVQYNKSSREPKWSFNGDMNKPSFSPSLLISSPGFTADDGKVIENYRCHSYIAHGQIEFLGDCSHDFKNKKVEMKDVEYEAK